MDVGVGWSGDVLGMLLEAILDLGNLLEGPFPIKKYLLGSFLKSSLSLKSPPLIFGPIWPPEFVPKHSSSALADTPRLALSLKPTIGLPKGIEVRDFALKSDFSYFSPMFIDFPAK